MTTSPRTATTRDVTGVNRTAILDYLRNQGSGTRRDIRVATGLGPATVDRLTKSLLADARLKVIGLARPRSGVGRPSELLAYVSPGRSILAVDITVSTVRARVVDLAGVVRFERSVTVELGPVARERGEARLAAVVALVSDCVGSPPEDAGAIQAVGIAVPGLVDDGEVKAAIELEWNDVPLARTLEDASGLPVFVENDANVTVLGEWLHGAAKQRRCAVALVLGRGMGAGLLVDGRLHRGAGAAAGEIGFLPTWGPGGRRGDSDEAGRNLESAVGELLRPWAGRSDSPYDLRIGPAFRRMMAGPSQDGAPSRVREVRSDFFDRIAVACASVAVVVEPEVIVLAGAFGEYAEESIGELRARLVDRLPVVPELVASALGFDAAITGVAELTIREVRDTTYLSDSHD